MKGGVGSGGRWRVATDAGGRAGAGAGEGAASASSSSARTTVLRLWSFGMLTNALALEAQSARMAVFMVVLQCEVAIYSTSKRTRISRVPLELDVEPARPDTSNLGLLKFPFVFRLCLERAAGAPRPRAADLEVVGFAA